MRNLKLIVLLLMAISLSGTVLGQKGADAYVYLDLAAGDIIITGQSDGKTSYSGKVYVNGTATAVNGNNNTKAFYIYQSATSSSLSSSSRYKTKTGYATSTDCTNHQNCRVPDMEGLTYNRTAWRDYIKNNTDVDGVRAAWASAISAQGQREATTHYIQVKGYTETAGGSSPYFVTFQPVIILDNVYTTDEPATGSLANCGLTFGNRGTESLKNLGYQATIKLKGDNRIGNIHYHSYYLAGTGGSADIHGAESLVITSFDGDGATTGSLTLTPFEDLYLNNNYLIGGASAAGYCYGLQFKGGTIFAGHSRCNGGYWSSGSGVGVTQMIGGRNESEITISGGCLTAVSNSTCAAIGGGGGRTVKGGSAEVTITGGEVYAYNNSVYDPNDVTGHAGTVRGFLPGVAIGAGTGADKEGNNATVSISGGYVYAQSMGGVAIGGGGSGYLEGGSGTVNITGGTVVAKSLAGSISGGGNTHSFEAGVAIGGGTGRLVGGSAEVTVSGAGTVLQSGSVGGGSYTTIDSEDNQYGAANVTVSGGTINAQFILNAASEGTNQFTMTGGSIGGKLDGFEYVKPSQGHAVWMDGTTGTVNLQGGRIHDCTISATSPKGGAIYMNSGTCNMSGSFTIENCSITGTNNSYGGALAMDGGSFNMTGGSIINCSANGTGDNCRGGAACVSGKFTMSNGTISACSSDKGGAAFVSGTSASFTMHSGTITGCSASLKGGGVCVANVKFSMDGGTISNNSSLEGGGVYQYQETTGSNHSVSITGGQIGGNQATRGGGVFVQSSGVIASLTLGSSVSIIDNMADYGGGIYVPYGTGVTMSSGVIGASGHGNSALFGGGIYNLGTINLQGGATVQYNTATSQGGGIYNDGTVTVSGTGASVVVNNNKLVLGSKGSRAERNNNIYIPEDGKCIQVADGTTYNSNTSIGFTLGSGVSKAVRGGQETPVYTLKDNNYVFGDVPYNITKTHPDSYYYIELSGNWASAITSMPASGFDLSSNTATISSAEGLAWLSHYVSGIGDAAAHQNVNVLLDNDIDMTGLEWVPIGYKKMNSEGTSFSGSVVVPFTGTFDGQGHTISGISLNTDLGVDQLGLFGSLGEGATVKNVMVGDMHLSDATGASTIGGIAGNAASGSNIINSYAAAEITLANASSVGGGMVGTNAGSVINSFAYPTLTSEVASTLGGIAGQNSGTIKNCYIREMEGSSHSSATFGYVAGTQTGSMDHCYIPSGSTAYYSGCSAAPSTCGAFTPAKIFSYDIANDNRVGDDRMVALLNRYVASTGSKDETLYEWVLPTTTTVNSGLPVIKYPSTIAVASADGAVLNYINNNNDLAEALNTFTTGGISLFGNADLSSQTVNQKMATFAIHPSASLLQGNNTIRALVNIAMQYTEDTKFYHGISSSISAWPLGFAYETTTLVPYNNNTNPCLAYMSVDDGIFPQDINLASPTITSSLPWDFYDFQETTSHWVNYRRNSLSHWNETNTPSNLNYNNHSEMQAGKGYLAAIALPDAFNNDSILLQHEGVLNYGNVVIPVTRTADSYYPGVNMIGNPYESYLDFNDFASTNSSRWGSETPFYGVYDKDNGFVYYADGVTENYPYTASRYIHKHQGIFVKIASAGDYTYNEDMRSNDGTPDFRDWERKYPLVNLIVTDGDGEKDICVVEMNRPDEGGAGKLIPMTMSNGVLYARQNDQDYGIVFTDGHSNTPLWFEAREEANYTLTWNTRHGEFSYLHLLDNMLGVDIDMLTTQQYVFTARPSDYRSRFKLVCQCTGVEENETVENIGTFAFMSNGQLHVDGEGLLQVIGINGCVLQQIQLNGKQNAVRLPEMASGMYILKLNERTQKIVL